MSPLNPRGNRPCQSSADARVGTRTWVLLRPVDYPAAHSMDTIWFGVDAHGHVGVFLSGENGPVPLSAGDGDLARLLRRLRGEPDPEDDDGEWDGLEQEAAERGLFVFEYIDSFDLEFIHPYTRTWEPGRAVHVDQLPPAARKEVGQIRLPAADFAAADTVQIVGQVKCFFYSDEDVGYLVPGTNEVRAIPGREPFFRTALPSFRAQHPDLTFVAPPDPKGKP